MANESPQSESDHARETGLCLSMLLMGFIVGATGVALWLDPPSFRPGHGLEIHTAWECVP